MDVFFVTCFILRTPKLNKTLVDVNTIDSCQGQEKDIIIISCVRTNGVGFLSDRQRVNVALTRAKHALFICGNFSSLDVSTNDVLEKSFCTWQPGLCMYEESSFISFLLLLL